jgi:cysteine desulfurase
MSGRSIYLDYHATTPVDPRVLQAMLPYFTEVFGNPASASHAFGWKAMEAVEGARRQVAALIGANAREIIFTSGATESNTFAIRGVTDCATTTRRRVVTSAIEHKSILEGYARLASLGWDVVIVPVDRGGRLRLDELERAVNADTALVSVMAANNEIGVVQPLEDIGRIARASGALFHVDGAQAAGKIPIDVNAMNIDLLSLTGHKMYGPKGCGALFVRRRTELTPLITGGGQERGMRSGTLNVPGIVGLGCACEICRKEMTEENARLRHLRDRLLTGLT